MRRMLLISSVLLAVACTGIDPSLDMGNGDPSVEHQNFEATVRLGESIDVPFVAEEIIANLTMLDGQEQVVVSGFSADHTRSLAFVLDTRELAYTEGSIDLSHHGAVYMESGVFGSDLLFDGTPQGTLEFEGVLEPGARLSATFHVIVPTYDRNGDMGGDLFVELQGQFEVHLLEDFAF